MIQKNNKEKFKYELYGWLVGIFRYLLAGNTNSTSFSLCQKKTHRKLRALFTH